MLRGQAAGLGRGCDDGQGGWEGEGGVKRECGGVQGVNRVHAVFQNTRACGGALWSGCWPGEGGAGAGWEGGGGSGENGMEGMQAY